MIRKVRGEKQKYNEARKRLQFLMPIRQDVPHAEILSIPRAARPIEDLCKT